MDATPWRSDEPREEWLDRAGPDRRVNVPSDPYGEGEMATRTQPVNKTLAVPKPSRKRKRRAERARCSVRGCRRRPVLANLCNTHLLRKADAGFSAFIRKRDGRCVRCRSSYGLQCMHIVSRRYRATRFDPENAAAGCTRCHVYFTHRPLEWEVFVDECFGAGTWARLREKALEGTDDWKELAVPWIKANDVEAE